MVHLREYYASENTPRLKVWVNGREISESAIMMYAATEPDVEAEGYVECLMRDNAGHVITVPSDDDPRFSQLVTYTLHGCICWAYSE